MREIKFRAWNPDTKMMGKGLPLDVLVYYDFRDVATNLRKWEWMQYTGLKDKNGVEIYEGDIVSLGGKWISAVDFGELKFWGGYDNDDYYGLGFRVGSEPLDPRGEPLEYIVIGNIYKNPELLKGDTKL